MSELTKIGRLRKNFYEAKRMGELKPSQVKEAYALGVIKKREYIRNASRKDLDEAASIGHINRKAYELELKRRR
jgi:hypothetical protein